MNVATQENPGHDSALDACWAEPALHDAIRNHYDGLIELYEDLWGEHIHHGYWAPGEPDPGRHAAQERLVAELVRFGPVPRGARVLDVGCGIGASAVLLARDHDCTVEGITLSAEQVRRAGEKACAAGVADRVTFRVADALHTDYADGSFDVVWALESCELMPDKDAFLTECLRVLRPGGTLVVATWCARDLDLTASEHRLLRRIYRDFVVSHVLPLDSYAELTERVGFTEVSTEDWTDNTRGTWKVSTDIAKPFVRDPSYIWKLIRAKGVDIFRFINSVPLMKQAYERDVMHYGVFRATRPCTADLEGAGRRIQAASGKAEGCLDTCRYPDIPTTPPVVDWGAGFPVKIRRTRPRPRTGGATATGRDEGRVG